MKCLIAIAVYDTKENERTAYTVHTYNSLKHVIDPKTTRIIFIDNGSCEETKTFLRSIKAKNVSVITNETNIGTAEAINLALRTRKQGEYCVKLDNDVYFHESWVEKLVKCFELNPNLGILGLKRKDIPNSPYSEQYPTKLEFVDGPDHFINDPWLTIEICDDIIGTCTMFNPKLLDKIGYLYQPGIYGFDDVLMCARSKLANYINAFFPSVEIDHMDNGLNPYTEWKKRYAGLHLSKISGILEDYASGERDIYYNPFKE